MEGRDSVGTVVCIGWWGTLLQHPTGWGMTPTWNGIPARMDQQSWPAHGSLFWRAPFYLFPASDGGMNRKEGLSSSHRALCGFFYPFLFFFLNILKTEKYPSDKCCHDPKFQWFNPCCNDSKVKWFKLCHNDFGFRWQNVLSHTKVIWF